MKWLYGKYLKTGWWIFLNIENSQSIHLKMCNIRRNLLDFHFFQYSSTVILIKWINVKVEWDFTIIYIIDWNREPPQKLVSLKLEITKKNSLHVEEITERKYYQQQEIILRPLKSHDTSARRFTTLHEVCHKQNIDNTLLNLSLLPFGIRYVHKRYLR